MVNDCDATAGSEDALCAEAEVGSLGDADLVLIEEAGGERVHAAAAGVGDVDGDGLADALIGAPGESTGGDEAGAIYVLLSDGALGRAPGVEPLSGAALTLTGEGEDHRAGRSVAGAAYVVFGVW